MTILHEILGCHIGICRFCAIVNGYTYQQEFVSIPVIPTFSVQFSPVQLGSVFIITPVDS